jgi:hypothetical protein
MTIESGRDANASGDVLWTQDIYAKDGTSRLLVGQIKALADAAVTNAGTASCRFEFWTANSSGSLTKALTIDSSQVASFVGAVTATGLFKISGIETGLTAHAGGTQAAALGLSATKSVHNVTIVGSANDSVVLPASTGGGTIHWVKNSAAANSLQLFGLSADTIDGVTAATGVAVAAGKSRLVVDAASGTWLSILGA